MRAVSAPNFTYLQIADGPVEWIVTQAAFFVQEFARLAVEWRTKQAVIEAFLQFLCAAQREWETKMDEIELS